VFLIAVTPSMSDFDLGIAAGAMMVGEDGDHRGTMEIKIRGQWTWHLRDLLCERIGEPELVLSESRTTGLIQSCA
jgi:hypothetical protein